MRLVLIFCLLNAMACRMPSNDVLDFFRQHPEFTDLFLVENADVQWSLAIQRDSAARGFWQLDGQRLHYRDSLGLQIEPINGRWWLADGHLELEHRPSRLQTQAQLVAPEHWQGQAQENGRKRPLDLRLLGSANADSLRFFRQAVADIAATMQLSLPDDSDSSTIIYQAPHYYQYQQKGEDAEFYGVPQHFPPTVWLLLRQSDTARFFQWEYRDGLWQCPHAPDAYAFAPPAQVCLLHDGWLIWEPPQRWIFKRNGHSY